MSEQLQLRRGTELQISSFTGAQGEATPATDTMRLHVHDGSTAGGWAHALESRKAVSDANYSVAVTDRQVAYTSLTAARTVSLPAASSYPAGAVLTVVEESGSCSATNTITLSRAGSDTINGAASAVIANAYGFLSLESNGSNAWTIVDQAANSLSALNINNGVSGNAVGSLSPFYVSNVGNTVLTFDEYSGASGAPVGAAAIKGRAARGLPMSPSAVQSGDLIFKMVGAGYNGGAFSGNRIQIVALATENWTSTANGAAVAVQVTPNGTTATAEAMRIDNTGYVGVGTTSPAQPLDVAGVIQSHGAYGSTLQIGAIEDTISCSGASSASTQQIPNRAIVLAVSVRVVTAITGATSFNVDATTSAGGGAGGSSGQFGSGLGVAAGSTNVGAIGPTAWYASSTIKLTASGGAFTGGQVRISIQYLLPTAPSS